MRDNFTSQNTPISQFSSQFYLLLSLFPWIPFLAITGSGQGTLGTDKQLVLVFALVNKLEGESPAPWIQKAGRWSWFMIIDQSREIYDTIVVTQWAANCVDRSPCEMITRVEILILRCDDDLNKKAHLERTVFLMVMLIEQWDTLKAKYGKFRQLLLGKHRPHEISQLCRICSHFWCQGKVECIYTLPVFKSQSCTIDLYPDVSMLKSMLPDGFGLLQRENPIQSWDTLN